MLENLLQKPESYRHKVALGISAGITLMIVTVWAYSNNFFGFGTTTIVTRSEEQPQQLIASVAASNSTTGTSIQTAQKKESTPASPIDNTKTAFGVAFNQIGKQFGELKESLASVLVPFITGIDVYEKTK